MNRFLEILHHAAEKKWCTNPECNTCGAMEYRAAIRQLGDDIAVALSTLDLTELTRQPDWDEKLRLALNEIRKAEVMDRILTAWLPQLDHQIRLADFILFYYVRRGALFAPMSIAVLEQWRDSCIELAVKTGDESLVESLICTVGDYRKHPELAEVVRSMAESGSYTILKALRRHNG
jgi:hypothetical protein